ncbi:MAG: midcut-by-XrtH protein [Comamonadaceae bacterium]|nr:midcut-by-XrtH protein [Comamonadaceae bacterium]
MKVKALDAGLFALLAVFLPFSATAQTITTGPLAVPAAPIAAVPVDNPLALAALVVVLAFFAWWALRHSRGAQRVLSMILVGALVGVAGHGSGLMAQVLNVFTNPSGQTLPIAIAPISSGNLTAGFQPADFRNESGLPVKIEAIAPPDVAQCFATVDISRLLPPGTPIPSPYPACSVGQALTNGSTCRVDVDAICRSLINPGPTLTSLSPNAGTASGGHGITLTGTGLVGATSVTFDGVPATSVNVVNSTTITAVTPAHAAGAVDIEIITANGAFRLVSGYTFMTTAVGQPTGGGVIAALNGGLSNLIAATADNSTGISWGVVTAVGVAAQSMTDGASNTAAIVAAYGSNGGQPYAAQLCNNYEVDSQGNTPCQAGNTCYNDWFLPASNQLATLFNNKTAVGGFGIASYWSSTEFSSFPVLLAQAQDFGAGSEFSVQKGSQLQARCVRAFIP